MESSIPLKEFITYISRVRGYAMPCRAAGGASGFGQEAEVGVRREPGPERLLGFPWDRQGRAE